jgi:3-methylcrotonyl-CoA carboxylase alpha subunit
MIHSLIHNGRAIALDIEARRPHLRLKVGGAEHVVGAIQRSGSEFEIEVDGRVQRGWCYASDGEIHVRVGGVTHVFGIVSDEAEDGGKRRGADEIRADMPGLVVAVHCAPGDAVKTGDKLVTIESMKLQMLISAPREAVVKSLPLAVNAVFERGTLLVAFVAEDEAGTAEGK